ncbi:MULTISPECIES: hypothetical protein [unclassified Paenibacillus]|uniref:hypothetical protein n=1 Tax=unclassified Paenibacillus TaxID=185978 RepID=UPI0027806C9F|nr:MULTISPECIES: hypothetical protein [unclassified Paenibacillus]MDQ0897536.1 hypothetical protein [Paenibacillus sp. V4I7]MDQ0916455.1 hypothetical protein [Paenibacillus sp. V4I5]
MALPITIMIILSLGGLSTLFLLRKIFYTIEIISYFLGISIPIQMVYTAITFNSEMIKITENVSVYWFLNMSTIIFVPCVTLWLFYLYFCQTANFFGKASLTIGWLLSMFGMELLFQSFGFFTFKCWNIGYSFFEWLFVLIVSGSFILWFRKLLRKQAFLRSSTRLNDST